MLIAGILAVFAMSELLLSPIGLAVTTKLAPQAFRAQMMALYFFSVGLGTSMSGVLAKYYDPAHEFAYFGVLGVVAIVAGLVVFGLSGWISRLMEGVHQASHTRVQAFRSSRSSAGSTFPPESTITVGPGGSAKLR